MDAQERLLYWLDATTQFLGRGDNAWVVQVFVVVLLVAVANAVQRVLLRRLQNQFGNEATWRGVLVESLRKPLTALIWVIGVGVAGEIILRETGAAIFAIVDPLREVGFIACVSWFLSRFVQAAEAHVLRQRTLRGQPVDATTATVVSRLLRISVFVTAALVILQTLGFSVSGVLAFGGVGGIAVGFAAKDLLANFFGALMIYLDRPFAIGDWIYSTDRDIEGTVEEIGWRLTRIRTFDKRPIYVPNSVFNNISVVNASRMTHRRIFETVGVRYDDAEKLEGILDDVRAMLRTHPEIDANQTLMVNFDRFGPSSLDFFLYCFTRTTVWTRYHEVKQDVLIQVHSIIAEHGAEVAFPTTTVHMPDALTLREGRVPPRVERPDAVPPVEPAAGKLSGA